MTLDQVVLRYVPNDSDPPGTKPREIVITRQQVTFATVTPYPREIRLAQRLYDALRSGDWLK